MRSSAKCASRRTLIALLLTVALVTAACGGANTTSGEDGTLRVVATTTILGDVVSNIVGDQGAVEVLMPLGADPHDFQASADQVAAINQADLVVANGLGLEESLIDVLDAAEGDGVRVLELAPLLDPLPFSSSDEAHESDERESDQHDADEHGSEDPHVWLDPVRMADGVELIATELASIAPAIDWSASAAAYAAELLATDQAIRTMLSVVPDEARRLVTNHDALGYFADRYDFAIVGTVIPGGSTLADPSSQALTELITVMRREGVSVIFAETTQPDALADAVAAELGEDAHVVELFTGSLGAPGSGAETLIELLTTNAGRIASALN